MANGRRLEKSRVVGMSCQCVTLRICLIFLLLTIENVVNLMIPILRDSVPDVAKYENNMMISRWRMTEAQTAVQDAIEKILGFPVNGGISNVTPSKLKKSATTFLVDVYENILNDKSKNCQKSHKIFTKFNLIKSDLPMICQSDIIVTMPAQSRVTKEFDIPGDVTRLWFDATAVPQNARMTGAKLKLYRRSDAKERGAFTIKAWRVSKMNSPKKQRRPHIARTRTGQVGWITLNVGKSLRYWMKRPDDNEGLYVTVHPTDTTSKNTRPEDIGIVEFNDRVGHEPFIIGFFNNSYYSIPSHIRPLSLTNPQPSDHQMDIDNIKINANPSDPTIVDDLSKNHTVRYPRESREDPCGVRPWRVSFKDMHWDDWIVAPERYDANYCSGRCAFPLGENMNSTNHAILQAIMNNFSGAKLRRPCCVPSKLSPTSIIHYVRGNNIVLSNINDMVIDSCGCR